LVKSETTRNRTTNDIKIIVTRYCFKKNPIMLIIPPTAIRKIKKIRFTLDPSLDYIKIKLTSASITIKGCPLVRRTAIIGVQPCIATYPHIHCSTEEE
jgi:hypothetical protein